MSKNWRPPSYMEITIEGQVYMRRWYLIQTPWFGIRVHNILLPDQDRALHDHPWNFTSVILKGGYEEFVVEAPLYEDSGMQEWAPNKYRWNRWSRHKRLSTQPHRVVPFGDCWTLIWNGPTHRKWGFTERPGHWAHWSEYESE